MTAATYGTRYRAVTIARRNGARIVSAIVAARYQVPNVALVVLAGCGSTGFEPEPLGPGERGVALSVGRVLSVDGSDRVYDPGMVLVRDATIEYVGPPIDVPAGYQRLDFDGGWAVPGMVDLHSHVLAGGFAPDTNEMILPVNPEFRASSWLVPGNRDVDRARAAGVTTLFGIPGSGTSIGGFGVVYKTKDGAEFRDAVVRDPGGMKVAQSHNPQRRAGDLGTSWSGLCWILEDVNDRARASLAEGRFDPALENLKKVHSGELPVLIHCAGSDGVANAVRMWRHTYDTNCVVSHGCWDAYKIAPYVVASEVPVNHGPRNMDWSFTRDSKFVGTADQYLDEGAKNFSLNTDSPIVPQEELFLQGSVGAHLGADAYQMVRALTAHPAESFGLGERLGSLEAGKDADVVVYSGDPLDPRSRALLVLIDGEVQYDRERDGQVF